MPKPSTFLNGCAELEDRVHYLEAAKRGLKRLTSPQGALYLGGVGIVVILLTVDIIARYSAL